MNEPAMNRVQIAVGGTILNPTQISSSAAGVYQVSVQLNANQPVGAALPLIVYLDGRSSYSAAIPVVGPVASLRQVGNPVFPWDIIPLSCRLSTNQPRRAAVSCAA